jgi:threonylcarbamoyladenosine tRNA methylthiotransferase MtaB
MEDKARLLDLPDFLSGAGGGGASCREAVAAFFSARGGEAGKDSGGKFRFAAERYSFHTRAFLKIQDGCDYRCSYCRVCVARGPSVSLDAGEVLRRFRALEAEGYREIVLTGINLMLYKADGARLLGLLERLLEKGSSRVRISSLEPEGITPELVRVLSHPRVCPHFHLPLQSGSDAVLRAMARRYTRSRAAEAVALLRSAKSSPFIAADIIAGFSGETGGDHAETESLVRELELASLHVFPFSRRPGTPAWDMPSRVPERVSRERAAALREISRAAWKRYADGLAGKSLEVLVEKRGAAGDWEGLAENYITVRGKEAPLPAAQNAAVPGALLAVRVKAAGDGFVWGELS